MKRLFALLFVALAITAGCRAQVTPNPVIFTCPVSTGTNYAALNPATSSTNPPVSGTTYLDSKPAAGEYCYIAQSYVASARKKFAYTRCWAQFSPQQGDLALKVKKGK